jgi:acetyltransferase-like isoleucine patch superfamily enzyme
VPWPVHFTSRIVHPERVRLGPGSTPGDMPGCYIQAINGIEVGEFCEFGPGVGLISANHNPEDLTQHLPAAPIRIGDRCWIGMHAIILPGVELGPRTVVGAGAVVTKSYPEGHVTLAGNPARVVRQHRGK